MRLDQDGHLIMRRSEEEIAHAVERGSPEHNWYMGTDLRKELRILADTVEDYEHVLNEIARMKTWEWGAPQARAALRERRTAL